MSVWMDRNHDVFVQDGLEVACNTMHYCVSVFNLELDLAISHVVQVVRWAFVFWNRLIGMLKSPNGLGGSQLAYLLKHDDIGGLEMD